MLETFKILLFLLWVNGLPPLLAILLRERFNTPVDGGRLWKDRQPIFGNNKTIRGVMASTLGGALLFPLISLPWWIAGMVAFSAMLGDLLSSFIKRRSNRLAGQSVFFLDQFFEAFLPLFFLYQLHYITLPQAFLILSLFIITAYTCSFFWLYITESSTPENYPRIIQSTVRFREWKSCHTPLARWQVWFNLTSFLSDQILLTYFFKITGLYNRGEQNALDIRIEEKSFCFSDLPQSLDGLRILFLVDLHLDGLRGVDLKLRELLNRIDADLCLIGGDLRMKAYGDISSAIQKLEGLMAHINTPLGKFGVLGNHDCIEMLPELEDAGIVMLVNDAAPVKYKGERIWIMGVDDPNYYRLHNAEQAANEITDDGFRIFLAHSPKPLRMQPQ